MKKFAFTLLLISTLFSIGYAQSGRRVLNPIATPAPTPEPSEEETGYSDSVPGRVVLSRESSSTKDKPPKLQKTSSKTDTASGDKTQTENATKPATNESKGDDDVVRVDTSLVTIPISVLDKNGMYIADLQQKNFKIFEDGKQQEIAYFGRTEQPFTVVLLLDTSASARYKIEEIQEAAISFVNQLQEQDSVMVVSFDSGYDVLAEPTSDRQTLYKAIRRARFGGNTSLYDAVDFAVRKRLSKVPGRKAVVLFTDGVDTSSHNSYDGTLRSVEESDTIIFPVYYDTYNDNNGGIGGSTNGGVMSSPYPPGMSLPIPGNGGIRIGNGSGNEREAYEKGKRYLQELAYRTGGRVYYAKWQPRGLEGAFEGIAEELRRQYSIGYYPADAGQNGQRKQVKVRVNRPSLVVRARDSYVVGKKDSTTKFAANFSDK